MAEAVVSWDDVETHLAELELLRGRRQDLGSAAGSVEVGATRQRPEPGAQTSPAHTEGGEEEVVFVLDGSGWSWQDGATYEIRAGDVLVHRIDEEAHTLVAGGDGLDVLAFGERASRGATTWLPRAGVLRVQETWVETPGGAHPREREAAAGRVQLGEPQPRPATMVALEDVEARHTARGRTDVARRDLGRAAGSTRTGLVHMAIAPGAESHPPHCHSAEEELFVALRGSGTLRLGDAEHPVRRGSVVSRPAGTGVAHSWVAGDDGLELLAYGQRDPRDMIFYPRSNKVAIRGLGLMFRVGERLGYWDGEA